MFDPPVDDSEARPKAEVAPGTYDDLIDAERELLSRSGLWTGKIALIKGLRDATGLGLREAKEAVEGYIARREGRMTSPTDPSWIDDLLDAERAAALREGRPLTKILLIKALRGASGQNLRDSRRAVEDYLLRKGGEGLQSGDGLGGLVVLLVLLGITALAIYWLT